MAKGPHGWRKVVYKLDREWLDPKITPEQSYARIREARKSPSKMVCIFRCQSTQKVLGYAILAGLCRDTTHVHLEWMCVPGHEMYALHTLVHAITLAGEEGMTAHIPHSMHALLASQFLIDNIHVDNARMEDM